MIRPIICALVALTVAGAAQTAEVKHPVYEPNLTEAQAESVKAGLQKIMDMSEDDLRALVPKVNGFLFCGCPNCDKGTQEGQLSWKGIADPFRAKCRYCGHEYPSEKYPEDKTKTGTNFKGETITYNYHEGPDGTEYHLSGRARYDRKHWLAARAYDMAKVYYATKDEAYARRAVLLMDALAEAYSHWCVHFDWPFRDKGPVKPEPPFPTAGGMWNRWFYTDVPTDLLMAYDLLADSGQAAKLSAELGVDVQSRIEDDLFRRSIWFVRTYKEEYSNMSPGIYQGMIIAGRVLGEPEYVHDGVNRFKGLLSSRFFYDGFWREGSISYHDQTIYWLARVAEYVKGYSDEEGFVSQIDGLNYQELDLMAQFPVANVALNMNKRFVYPDGHIVTSHDAWARSQRGALAESEPYLLPGVGYAVLGTGEAEEQAQAHLHFTGGYGHQHYDNLHFTLWAGGHELLPDLGYTHTKFRYWTVCTPAHNTVAIDEGNHAASGQVCNLLLWEPDAGPAQVVEAEAKASYPGLAEEFRRMIALVKVSETDSYALDIFRVKGGSQHDYFLHGSGDADQVASCTVDTAPVAESLLGPGVEYSLPSFGESDQGKAPDGRNVGYGFIQNLKAGKTDAGFSLKFEFADGRDSGYTGSFLAMPGTEVVLGEAPSIRRAGEADENVEKYMMPVAAIRRAGEKGLQSTFVAVHRGHRGEDFVSEVSELPGVTLSEGAVAVFVQYAGGSDALFACTEGSDGVKDAQTGALVCDGRFGLVRFDAQGQMVSSALVGGSALQWGDASINMAPGLEGDVTGVREPEAPDGSYALEVTGRLPASESLKGRSVLVTQADGVVTAHAIDSVEAAGEGSVVWLASDPGFSIEDGGTRFRYFPQRTVEGMGTYRIEGLAAVVRD